MRGKNFKRRVFLALEETKGLGLGIKRRNLSQDDDYFFHRGLGSEVVRDSYVRVLEKWELKGYRKVKGPISCETSIFVFPLHSSNPSSAFCSCCSSCIILNLCSLRQKLSWIKTWNEVQMCLKVCIPMMMTVVMMMMILTAVLVIQSRVVIGTKPEVEAWEPEKADGSEGSGRMSHAVILHGSFKLSESLSIVIEANRLSKFEVWNGKSTGEQTGQMSSQPSVSSKNISLSWGIQTF